MKAAVVREVGALAELGEVAEPPGDTHAIAGEIRLELERVPLDSVADAWRRQAEGAGAKLVVVP